MLAKRNFEHEIAFGFYFVHEEPLTISFNCCCALISIFFLPECVRENEASLTVLPDLLMEIDSMSEVLALL